MIDTAYAHLVFCHLPLFLKFLNVVSEPTTRLKFLSLSLHGFAVDQVNGQFHYASLGAQLPVLYEAFSPSALIEW